MRILITDWSALDDVLPIALKYHTGLEVLEFASPENLDRASSLAEDIRQKVSDIPLLGFHGPFSELVPASRDPRVRQVARDRFQAAYDLALSIGAQHIVLHSGFFPKTYPRDKWIQNAFDFWIDFLADKLRPGLLHLENVYEDDHTALAELLDRVNESLHGEILTACLDIGHVHANSSKTMDEWITGLGDRIRYVHLHNNDGILDDHWGFWKGQIDIAHVLDLLSKHSPKSVWTIETFIEDIEPSLVWLQRNGFL